MSNMQRVSVVDNELKIESTNIPVAQPTIGHTVSQWIYENLPLVKGQSVSLIYEGVESDSPSCIIVLDTPEKLVEIRISEKEVSSD